MEPESGSGRVPDMNLAFQARGPAAPASGAIPSRAVLPTEPTITAAEPTGEVDIGVDAPASDDVRSFDDFYAAHRNDIGRAVALALGDVDLAGDATDEALARAYERWSLVSRLERPEGWVYRVAVNWAISVLRRRRRSLHRLYERPLGDGLQVPDPAVHDALGALDVKHRSVVVCRHLLGWSVAETADALGVQEGTVKSRLHRAHQVLQSRLGHLRDTKDER
jgi:DNA-directed RNA polymerase specialized sigma24 family protein